MKISNIWIRALTHMKPLEFKNAQGMLHLTRREEEVVHLVADGMKNRENAHSLR